jgi:uncharacterized protein (DUF433 family)
MVESDRISQYIERVAFPGEENGYPRIVGRRISVVDIVLWKRDGMSIAEIAAEYDLTEDVVTAALDFYQANQEEIERYIVESESFFEAGLLAQQHDPIYLGLKARREAIILRERGDLGTYGQ